MMGSAFAAGRAQATRDNSRITAAVHFRIVYPLAKRWAADHSRMRRSSTFPLSPQVPRRRGHRESSSCELWDRENVRRRTFSDHGSEKSRIDSTFKINADCITLLLREREA